ncbi:MAG: DUF5683 domain-containing protein [Rikenellaceae bacterium]
MKRATSLIALLIILAATTTEVCAQKKSERIQPRWVNNAPKSSNPRQQYIVVEDLGQDITELRTNSNTNLNNYIKKEVQVKGAGKSEIQEARVNDYMQFLTKINVENYSQQKIDEYWVRTSTSHYRYYSLYAVSTTPGVMFEQARVTDRYGARGLWRSALVPSWGQFYKGSKVKGGLILGGIVASGIGVIFTESQRSDYAYKATQTYDVNHIRTYLNKSSNYETARNICIGSAAAIYLYNLIDATVAPGAKRVKIIKKRNTYSSLNIYPTTSSEGSGLLATYKF